MNNTSHNHYRVYNHGSMYQFLEGNKNSNVITAMNGSPVCGTGISQQEYREAVRSREGLYWIYGPCLVYIHEDAPEDDDSHIYQLGEYVVHPLIVEPDVSVNIPVSMRYVFNKFVCACIIFF